MAPALNIPVEPEIIEKANKLAKSRGVSLAELVRMLIIAEIEKSEQVNELAKAGQQPDKT